MKTTDCNTPEQIAQFIEGALNDFESAVSTKQETFRLMVDLVVHVATVSNEAVRKEQPPDFKDVIESRVRYFNQISHTYEMEELKRALNTIIRLVPPIQFKIGGLQSS